MATEQPSNTSNSTIKYAVVAIALFCLLILIVYGLYLLIRAPMEGDNTGIAWYAQYGDAFGVITSFFTAAGTIGLVATIVLQYQTLKAQQLELAETRKELSAQKDELAGQKEIMSKQQALLEEQHQASAYDLFIRNYDSAYIKNEKKIQSFLNSYDNFKLSECAELVREKDLKNFVEFIEGYLGLIDGFIVFFYNSRDDDELRFFFLLRLMLPTTFKNIYKLASFYDDQKIVKYSELNDGSDVVDLSKGVDIYTGFQAVGGQEIWGLFSWYAVSFKAYRNHLRQLLILNNSFNNRSKAFTFLDEAIARLKVSIEENIVEDQKKLIDSQSLFYRDKLLNDLYLSLEMSPEQIEKLIIEPIKNYKNTFERFEKHWNGYDGL